MKMLKASMLFFALALAILAMACATIGCPETKSDDPAKVDTPEPAKDSAKAEEPKEPAKEADEKKAKEEKPEAKKDKEDKPKADKEKEAGDKDKAPDKP